ncbi:competence type IV pilus assembly protein ComGB [Virgibacillus sediminis]|uniref:Competence type IV pilus assembly protein ComGB n=1 Tax=Virgibacillus sediminis TaxID=202260 RepID=A0ABV7A5S3_9BACI
MGLSLRIYSKVGKKGLSQQHQLRFLDRLSRLLSTGYPLIKALEAVKWDGDLKLSAGVIIQSLKNGSPLDKAFEEAYFHPSIISYLYFIQANGDIQGSIAKCAKMFEDSMKHKKKIRDTVRYPLILLFIFSILFYFLKNSVLPSFADLFHTNSKAAAASIHLSLLVIDITTTLLIAFMVLLALAVVFNGYLKKFISIDKQIGWYQLIPVYRHYLKIRTSFFFATHFGMMLRTGMPFSKILSYMTKQDKLPIISYYSSLMEEELKKGLPIYSLLTQLSFLDRQLTSIFRRNADMQELEKDLLVYADMIMEELERKIIKAITLIQPIFFILLAGVIIFIYITLMWPMFQLIESI